MGEFTPVAEIVPEALAWEKYQATTLTEGDWATEDASAEALDAILQRTGLWRVYREVPGELTQPRPAQTSRGVRIDRILLPDRKLIDAGWTHGAVGIDAKRSGIKIGRPIAQLMDYSRTVWTLPVCGGLRVWLDWLFLWPMSPRQSGPLESVMAQHRIGSASTNSWNTLQLKCGGNLLRVTADGQVTVGGGPNGTKVGSR